MSPVLLGLAVCGLSALSTAAGVAPLQSFVLKDYLGHQWTDEIVHFTVAYSGTTTPRPLTLTDAARRPVPCQITGLKHHNGKVTGTVWTVVTLAPNGSATFHLRPGKPVPSRLRLVPQGKEYLLGNEHIALRLPRLPGRLAHPVDLTSLPGPLLAVTGSDGTTWFGRGVWTNTGPALQVKQATTRVIEQGPVRITVRYRLTLTDGRFYQADIGLGARQDCALVTEEANIVAPKTAFRFSFQPGLRADRVFWHNQWAKCEFAGAWKRVNTAPTFGKEQVICTLRPWSFWWTPGITEWAGFYREGAEPLVGVMALRPSHWSPTQWDGFAQTAIPVTARPGGTLDVTLCLGAMTRKGADGKQTLEPLRRTWAVVVGSAAEAHPPDTAPAALRLRLVKHSEFPLDAVMRYGFDYTPAQADRKHPFLLVTDRDISRVRRQYRKLPQVKAVVDKAIRSLARQHVGRALREKGWEQFFTRHYHHNAENWLLAYIGSDDPKYGHYLAAVARGLRKYLMRIWVENPSRPAIGAYGPWAADYICRLALYDDLLSGTDLLAPTERRGLRAANVFFAHVLAHPDYWNTQRGLCSANPNMTSMIKLPLGVEGLLLAGHPRADRWLAGAEGELKRELKHWVTPGGAWIECPGYQAPSLDGIFLLAQAIRQVTGRDYFADPNLKATMEYYGQILTPPDPRYPTWRKPGEPPWSTLPTIGDTPAGQVACYNGWMAAACAKTDPDYSARQQFYWKAQGGSFIRAGRGTGFILAMTDHALPATPPSALAGAFPGFGSVMRTSWTDARATYLAHRTGPCSHHYHDDFNEILFAAKGAPLAWDFGNQYVSGRRDEPWYHNRVSFCKPGQRRIGSTGRLVHTAFLPRMVDYSYGLSTGGGNQQNHRHVLLVRSDDPLGANYVLVRDATVDGQPKQKFHWNLFCLSKQPEVQGRVVHFPGQFGVDLDVHLVSPAGAPIEQDRWSWEARMAYWGKFSEEMFGVRVAKTGSAEDFLALLYPRAAGQGPAQVTAVDTGRGVVVTHMEGRDVVLLSPGKAATVSVGDTRLQGEIALVRRYTGGTLRLAVVAGAGASATCGPWSVRSDGPVAVRITGMAVEGETSGDAHAVHVGLPSTYRAAAVTLGGKPIEARREKNLLTIELPVGSHTFTIQAE